MTALNNTHTKYKTKLLLTIIIVLCFIFGGGFYILKQSNITNNKDNIVELTPDFIEAIQRYEKLKSLVKDTQLYVKMINGDILTLKEKK